MGSQKKPRAPCQPATFGDGFVGMPKRVIESDAYQSLSVHARAALLEINNRMDGWNNGKIGIGQREIVRRLRCSPRKVVQALAELMERGLIDVSAEARWTRCLAREYRLTYIAMPRSPATNDYLLWKPAEKFDGSGAVAAPRQSATASVARPFRAASASVASKSRNPQKSVAEPEISASDAVAHITKPYPGRGAEAEPGQDQPETPSSKTLIHGGPSVADRNSLRPETLAMARKLGRLA